MTSWQHDYLRSSMTVSRSKQSLYTAILRHEASCLLSLRGGSFYRKLKIVRLNQLPEDIWLDCFYSDCIV